MTPARETILYFTQGSSDKIYQAQILGKEGGFVVNFAYGRRGKPISTGTKTNTPVSFEDALKIHDKLIASKTAKGYTPQESGEAYAATAMEGRVTGFAPQLLCPVDQEEALALIKSGEWLVQTKHDGERRGLFFENDTVTGANRRGLEVALRQDVADALAKLGRESELGEFAFDAEDMGSHVVIFDVTSMNNIDVKTIPFGARASILGRIEEFVSATGTQKHIRVDIPAAMIGEEFAAHIQAARQNGEEGVVLRRRSAVYAAGRPASGGDVLKLKFVESATVRVAKANKSKRSITMEVMHEGGWVDVGRCTVPANQDIPADGSLIEVRYLYAYPGGALFQPTLVGPRLDLDQAAATTAQLKFIRPQT